MWTRQNGAVARDLDFEIGLGWWPVETDLMPGVKLYGHGGDLSPFHALLMVEPESGIGVCILVNSANGLGSFSLSNIAAGTLRAFALSEKGIRYPDSPTQPRVIPMPAEVATRLAGAWSSPNGLMRFKRSVKGMKVFAFGNWMDADYRSDGSMVLAARVLGIKLPIPILEEIYVTFGNVAGEDCLAFRTRGIMAWNAERVIDGGVDPAWTAPLGEWIAVDKEADPMFAITKASFSRDKATGIPVATVVMGGQAVSYPVASRRTGELYLVGHGRNLGSAIRVFRKDGEERIETFGVEFKRKK
jgi:hypothetical protein